MLHSTCPWHLVMTSLFVTIYSETHTYQLELERTHIVEYQVRPLDIVPPHVVVEPRQQPAQSAELITPEQLRPRH